MTRCDYCKRDDSPVYLADGKKGWYACATCEADLQIGTDSAVTLFTDLKKAGLDKDLTGLPLTVEAIGMLALYAFGEFVPVGASSPRASRSTSSTN